MYALHYFHSIEDYLTERFICLACEICLSKTNISYISDMLERIVGSTGNSSELNNSGDQAADSQQQEAEETIPESSTSRYGRKRTRVLREKLEKMCDPPLNSSHEVWLSPFGAHFHWWPSPSGPSPPPPRKNVPSQPYVTYWALLSCDAVHYARLKVVLVYLWVYS